MAFLDNARGTDEKTAERVREAMARAQQAVAKREPADLVEVVARYQRMSLKYEEFPIVVPRDVLPALHALAMNYLGYPKLHIEANTGNPAVSKFVALTPDKELLVIELVSQKYRPEQTDEDVRRTKFVAGS